MAEVDRDGRFLPLGGADNVRDLGGIALADGRSTRPRRLLRAELTHALTEQDAASLADVRTVLDLRGMREVTEAPLGWPAAGVARVHAPLPLDDRDGDVGEPVDLAAVYIGYMELNPLPLVHAARTLLDPANHPVLFHCAAGKDRTGTLAAIVLELLGVPAELIVEDYALTAPRIDAVMARLSGLEIYQADFAAFPPWALLAERQTMVSFLEQLESRHGGAEAWLLANGIGAEEIARFRVAMIEERPAQRP